jgi:hypothetical protein
MDIWGSMNRAFSPKLLMYVDAAEKIVLNHVKMDECSLKKIRLSNKFS